jgi:uroporphyrinogen-III decarboxylase
VPPDSNMLGGAGSVNKAAGARYHSWRERANTGNYVIILYGHRWCIIGNIDSSRTLPYGTPADVAAEVREAIDTAAPGGGYILASDHSLHDGIPINEAEKGVCNRSTFALSAVPAWNNSR